MGLRRLEQGKFIFSRNNKENSSFPKAVRDKKSFRQKLSARPDVAQDIRQEFKFVKLRMGLAPLCERVGHNVLDQG